MFEKEFGVNITNVHFNSKSIKPSGLFIPIKGEKLDGHLFLEDAINHGAIATLWNQDTEVPEKYINKVKFIKVEDTLKSFQDLAKRYRETIRPIVIGVTGSNGKTTTKEFLDVVLSENFKVHKNTGNFNNHLGVPLTLLSMPEDTEVCIVEMGMNHAGEISVLTNIAQPDYGVITNIGESHIGLLGSRFNIAKAKTEILEGLKNKQNVIYDGDEPLLDKLNGFAINNKDIINVQQKDDKLTFEFERKLFELPTFGYHNAKNAAFAIKIAELLNVDSMLIQKGLKQFKNQPLRLEYKETQGNSFLLDCYNASLTSMKSALSTFLSINSEKEKIAILGDIFELGNESITTHKEIGNIAASCNQLTFWFVGDLMKSAYEQLNRKNNCYYFPTKKELLNFIEKNKYNLSNKYYLLKASRGMKLEEIYNNFNQQ